MNTPILTSNQAEELTKRRHSLCFLKVVIVFAALTITSMSYAEDGRIHITFLKAGYGSGSGYLFYQDQKYGLGINSTEITAIDLVGTASNLHSAADIIGTYTAADAGSATLRQGKTARFENAKGVVLEMRTVNLNRLFSLNLSGMTIKNLGWQPFE
jgi:hypothetical protein